MTSLQRKRETYRRLWLICEVYKPEWKAALERARQQTGLDTKVGKPRKPHPQKPHVVLPLGLMAVWREQGLPPQEIAARVKQMNEAKVNA